MRGVGSSVAIAQRDQRVALVRRRLGHDVDHQLAADRSASATGRPATARRIASRAFGFSRGAPVVHGQRVALVLDVDAGDAVERAARAADAPAPPGARTCRSRVPGSSPWLPITSRTVAPSRRRATSACARPEITAHRIALAHRGEQPRGAGAHRRLRGGRRRSAPACRRSRRRAARSTRRAGRAARGCSRESRCLHDASRAPRSVSSDDSRPVSRSLRRSSAASTSMRPAQR